MLDGEIITWEHSLFKKRLFLNNFVLGATKKMDGKRVNQAIYSVSGKLLMQICLVIALVCIVFTQQSPASTVNATADVNLNTLYQQLEGFGAAGAWYEGWLVNSPQSSTLYNILFRDSGFSIYRIRNTYGYDSGYMSNTGDIVSAAKARNPNIKIMISSWSPPTYLKSTGQLDSGTLIGGPSDYNYAGFATWWADSITAWAGYGVNIDYVNIQNEPEYNGNDRCLFNPTENSTYAGYNKAFRAVWQEFESRWGPNVPKLLAPETGALTSAGSYINALDDNAADLNHIYGFANHLYDFTYSSPDTEPTTMTNYKNTYGYKPLLQTEYSDSAGNTNFTYGIYTAQHIHNSLVYEGATAYLYWDAFWVSPSGLISFSGNYPNTSYTVNPPYYFMKHYAYFTRPGWYRSSATTASSDLRITAFRNITDTNMAIVILNKSTTNDVNLTLSLSDFAYTKTTNEIYQTTSSSYWVSSGTFSSGQPLLIPAQSITTIHLATYDTCAAVQAGGYKLESDINGDCYVDYADLEIIADNWLRTDCNEDNNWCNGAGYWTSDVGNVDFIDFNGLAWEWMQCNNPEDPNCPQNW